MTSKRKKNAKDGNELESALTDNEFSHKIKIELKFDLSDSQRELLEKLFNENNKVFFLYGPAGTAKTYTAILAGLELLRDRKFERMMYLRSAVESADQRLGFLPGDASEKMGPFFAPFYEKISELLSPGDITFLQKNSFLETKYIGHIRGGSWSSMFVVVDESQNLTFKELVTILTRIGENTKIVFCGDLMQSDIHGKSGFQRVLNIFSDDESQHNGIVSHAFTADDIVRSQILKFIMHKLNAS